MKFFKPIFSTPQRRGLPKPNLTLWPDHSVRLARDTKISLAEAAFFAASGVALRRSRAGCDNGAGAVPIGAMIMQQAQGKDDERMYEESGTEIAELETALRRILQLPSGVAIGTRSPAGLGLSSLGAITLQHQLQSLWAIELTVSEILGAATVDELGALIRARRSGGSATGGATSSQSGGVLI